MTWMRRANGRRTEVTSPTGVFWVINGSNGDVVWATKFSRVNVTIAGEAEDFNKTTYSDAFRLANLLLHAFAR